MPGSKVLFGDGFLAEETVSEFDTGRTTGRMRTIQMLTMSGAVRNHKVSGLKRSISKLERTLFSSTAISYPIERLIDLPMSCGLRTFHELDMESG